MSEYIMPKKKGRVCKFVSFAIILSMCLSVLPLFVPSTGGTPIPATISTPMTISVDTTWDSGTCTMSANLTVQSPATLRIQNVTINVVNNWTTSGGGGGGGNKSASPYLNFNNYFGIKVQDGAKLVIVNSTIQGKSKGDRYNILVEGTLEVRASTFKQLDNDGIYIDGDDGTDPIIAGNTFQNDMDGLVIYNTTSNINNNTFSAISDDGIWFTNSNLHIQDNTFSGTSDAIWADSSDCIVENNNIAFTSYGVYSYNGECYVKNNTIHGDGYGYTGVYVESPNPIYEVNDNEVYDCYVGIYSYGNNKVFLNYLHDVNEAMNIVLGGGGGGGNKTQRALAGAYVAWNNITSATYSGINIMSANNVIVENNSISNVGSMWDTGRGLMFDMSSGSVSDNTISNIQGYGVSIRQGASTLAFNNNKISQITANNQGPTYSAAIAVEYANTYSEWDLRAGYFDVSDTSVFLKADNSGTIRIWNMDLTPKGIGSNWDFLGSCAWANSYIELYDSYYDDHQLSVEKYGSQCEASIKTYWTVGAIGTWESTGDPIAMATLTVKDSYGQEAFTGDTYSDGTTDPFYLSGFSETLSFNQWNGTTNTVTKVYSPYQFHIEKALKGRTYFNDTNLTIDQPSIIAMSIDDVPPFIEITSPYDGALVNTTTIFVLGRTELLSHISVNNVDATVYKDGSFEAQIELDKEGKNTITVMSLDKGLNQAWVAINVTLDTIAPLLDVTSPEDGGIYNKMVLTIKGTSEPGVNLTVGGQSVNVGADGAWETTMTFTKEGANSVTVISRDPAGNTVTLTRAFTIDVTPPTLILAKPLNNTLTKNPTVDVSGSVEKECTLTVNGRKILYDGSTFSTMVEVLEGSNVITVTATDAAGNSKTAKSTVFRDTVAPLLVVNNPIDNLRTSKFSITVNGTTEAGAIVRINSIEVPNNNGTFSDTVFLNEGSNRITIEAQDLAGNTATKVRKVFKEAGGTADPVTITSPVNGTTVSSSTITIKGSLNEPGALVVNGHNVVVDTNDNFEYDVPLVEGTNTISVTLKDNQGNNYTVTWTVIKDTTPPEVTITSPKAKVDQANVLVQGQTEPGATVTVNGMMVYVSPTGEFTAPVALNPGNNKIYVIAVDKVGNAKPVTKDVKYEPKGGVAGLGAGSEMTLGLFALLIVMVIIIMVLLVLLMVKMGQKGGGSKPEGPAMDEDEADERKKEEEEDEDEPEDEDEEEEQAPAKGRPKAPAAKAPASKPPASKPLPPPLPPKRTPDMKVEVRK